MGRIIRNTISYGFVTLILAALGFCIYLFLDDLDGPEVTMTPDTGRISPTQEITLKLTDAKSGVRSVVVTIHRNNQSLVILDKVFSEPAPVQTTSFNLKNAGLRDGAFELEITARDNSLMSFGKGNGTTRKWNMQLDTQPPKVRIKTTVPALRRGSVTAIAYSVSEDASMTGVQLGEQFFPAFLQPNGLLDGDFVKRIHGHLDVGRIDIRVVGQDVNLYVVVHNSLNRNKNSHNKNSNSRPKRAVVENRLRTFLSCTIERRRQL